MTRNRTYIIALLSLALVCPSAPARQPVVIIPAPSQVAGKPGNGSPSRHQRLQIQGTILSATDEQPLAGARVILIEASGTGVARFAATGADGVFRFLDVEAGNYSLQAQGTHFPLQSLTSDQVGPTFTLGGGSETNNLIFRLLPDALISGTILDEHGEGVRDANVTLHVFTGQGEMRKTAETRTNDVGAYRFAHLLPAKYLVAVETKPWYARAGSAGGTDDPWSRADNAQFNVIYPITYYPRADSPNYANAIDLGPGGHFVADITLTPVPANSR
jgi:hypothetical protein